MAQGMRLLWKPGTTLFPTGAAVSAVALGMLAANQAIAGSVAKVWLLSTWALVLAALSSQFATRHRLAVWGPLGLPILLIAVIQLGPATALVFFSTSVGRVNQLTDGTVISLCLTVASIIAGAVLVPLLTRPLLPQSVPATEGLVPQALLAGALLVRLSAVIAGSGSPYGADQIAAAGRVSIVTLTNALAVAGILLCLRRSDTRLRLPLLLIGAYILVAVASGDRSSIMLVLIVTALGAVMRSGRTPKLRVVTAVVVGFVVLQTTADLRANEAPVLAVKPSATVNADTVLRPISSPAFITEEVTQRVPEQQDHTWGSTYGYSIVRLIPSPVVNRLLGPPTETGSFRYRDLIAYTNPNHGFSFAFTAEAYLNFGIVGVGMAGFVLGTLLGFAWRHRNHWYARATYIALVATLPYGLRSDALTHMKSVIYPLAILGLVSYWRQRRKPTAAQRPTVSPSRPAGSAPGVSESR